MKVTPLTAACTCSRRNRQLELVKYLVKACRVDVNLPDNFLGRTPLAAACYVVNMPVAMYFLREVIDLDVNIADTQGNVALHFAVWFELEEGYTQLHSASVRGDVAAVRIFAYASELPNTGHRINAQDNDGDTPLHKACRYGHIEIIETLMLAEANETMTNNRGETPARVAERAGYDAVTNLLNRKSLWQVLQRELVVSNKHSV